MAITHADVSGRTGKTYSATSDPTSTQVGLLITGATNILSAEKGSTADDTARAEIEIILDICEHIVHNYIEEEKSKNGTDIAPAPKPKIIPILNDDIRRKIRALIHPSEWFVSSGLTYER